MISVREPKSIIELRTVALIPAYNEGGKIREVIQATQEYVDHIVVCDDGSTDDTLMTLDSLDVDIVRHEDNCGYGAALVSLFKYCQSFDADYAVTIDADGQHAHAHSINEVNKHIH